ncbi:MAG: hypothetical protein OEY86_01940 [Nitrospira sp.]|nr:hypothetical protein [Nitrospira sp.]
MNRACCILVILSTLVMSGCGIKLFTNKVEVECAQDTTTLSEPSKNEELSHRVDQNNLPSKTLRTRPPKPPSGLSSSTNPIPAHRPAPSCRIDEKTVEDIAQITSSSCWAASAETVMRFHTNSSPPNQCDIIGRIASKEIGQSVNCCRNIDQGNCQRNGLPSKAFKEYKYGWRWVKGPLEPEKLAAQLCSNGPFIFILRYSGGGGHSFVVRDYFYDEDTKKLSLWVYDHSGPDSNGIDEIWDYEDYAMGRWGSEIHTHDVNYVYITPPDKR